jgi:Holliday junction resolvase RusA-like endonuclease
MVATQRPGALAGKVAVEIGVRRITNSDIDNRIKCVLDLLQTMRVIGNDRDVEKVTAEWRDDITAQWSLEAQERPSLLAAAISWPWSAPPFCGP